MPTYSFLDLAYDILKDSKKPLTYQEIWQTGKASGQTEKIRTSEKTPWQSLGAQLYIEVRDNEQSKFIKVGERPARFFLASREKELPSDIISVIEKEEAKPKENTAKYHERDLHPLLAYFASTNLSFNRGRPIYTCDQNIDFKKFLQDVKIDFESKRLHRSEYDEVHKEIKEYIRSKLHIDVQE